MNIQHSFSHTDLALELKDELEESLEEQQAFDGIKIQQERIGERGLQETVIEIDSEEGEKQLGKPRGIYVTLEGEKMSCKAAAVPAFRKKKAFIYWTWKWGGDPGCPWSACD